LVQTTLDKHEFQGNLLSPLPIILVGTQVNGKPNFLVIGYSCPFDFGKYIFFNLSKRRYTSIGIHEKMTFSVNIPTEDLIVMKSISVEVNLVGIMINQHFLTLFTEN